MSQTATQDEDILIISDDTSSPDSDIFLEENVDVSPSETQESETSLSLPKTEVKTEEELVSTPTEDTSSSEENSGDFEISFGDEPEADATETTPVESSAPVSQETPASNFDFSNLSTEDTAAATTEDTIETPDVPEVAIETLEVPAITEEMNVAPIEDISMNIDTDTSTDDTNLNDILSGTIAKLEKRQETIASDKATKTSQVQDLKNQIAKLEEEVALHEAEIEALDVEDDKIGKNITQLEKMKLADDEVTKEHNAKRVAKK